MAYLGKFVSKMSNIGKSKYRRVDIATSNSSLSNLRYVIQEKPKWKVFRKRELVPLPAYCKSGKRGCPCGSSSPCKQKITPRGVTIHYPQKKKKAFSTFSSKKRIPKKAGFVSPTNPKSKTKVKTIKQKRFLTFRLDKIHVKPTLNYGIKTITPTSYKTDVEAK